MALWLVLAMTVLMCSVNLSTAVSPTVLAMAEENARTKGYWRTLGCGLTLAALVLAAAWVTHAFEVGDWRYAAIGLAPFICSAIRVPTQRLLIARRKRRRPVSAHSNQGDQASLSSTGEA